MTLPTDFRVSKPALLAAYSFVFDHLDWSLRLTSDEPFHLVAEGRAEFEHYRRGTFTSYQDQARAAVVAAVVGITSRTNALGFTRRAGQSLALSDPPGEADYKLAQFRDFLRTSVRRAINEGGIEAVITLAARPFVLSQESGSETSADADPVLDVLASGPPGSPLPSIKLLRKAVKYVFGDTTMGWLLFGHRTLRPCDRYLARLVGRLDDQEPDRARTAVVRALDLLFRSGRGELEAHLAELDLLTEELGNHGGERTPGSSGSPRDVLRDVISRSVEAGGYQALRSLADGLSGRTPSDLPRSPLSCDWESRARALRCSWAADLPRAVPHPATTDSRRPSRNASRQSATDLPASSTLTRGRDSRPALTALSSGASDTTDRSRRPQSSPPGRGSSPKCLSRSRGRPPSTLEESG